jgi:very-short-patch-repair endonuclease
MRTMVQQGELISLARGVYITGDVANRMQILPGADTAMRAMAALATLGPGTVVSHVTAAELQVEIRDADGNFIGRVDFLWRQFRTIAEVDGAAKYDDRTRARAELRRDKLLRAALYEVEHFTWRDVVHEQDEVGSSLRTAFRRGGQRGASGPGSAA